MKEMTLTQNLKQKLIWGIPFTAIIFGLAEGVCFPYYFKLLFFCYCIAGTVFFFVLDLPFKLVAKSSRIVALMKIVVFYLLIAGFYSTWGQNLAQYDPENEKVKINATLKKYADLAKKQQEAHDEATAIALFKERFDEQLTAWEDEDMDEDELDGYSELFKTFLKSKTNVFVGDPIDKGKKKVDIFDKEIPEEMIAKGKKVFESFECYNCHVNEPGKVTKRRGPNFTKLHLGTKKTAEWIRMAILDPRAEMEDKYRNDPKLKKAMPADYRKQMFEEDVIAIVAYMKSFK